MSFFLYFFIGAILAPIAYQPNLHSSEKELSPVVIEEKNGSFVTEHYKEMWDLCNAVYSEYPYLYTAEGKDYVYKYYLDSFENSPDAAVFIAVDQKTKKFVGFATGICLSDYKAHHYKQPFIDKGIDLRSIYYIADLVLLPAYRGQGLEQKMCQALEEKAKKGSYKSVAYLVINEAERTKHFKPEESKLYLPYFAPFWQKLGFSRSDLEFVTKYEIVGEQEETPHKSTFWMKSLQQ